MFNLFILALLSVSAAIRKHVQKPLNRRVLLSHQHRNQPKTDQNGNQQHGVLGIRNRAHTPQIYLSGRGIDILPVIKRRA